MGLLEGVYRAIGAVARVNRRLSLMRINFLPLNLVLIVLLAAGVSIGIAQLRDVQNNSDAPSSQPLTTILGPGAGPRSFVTVSGTLFTAGRLEYGTKGTGGKLKRVDKAWAPLLDRGSHKVLFVQLPKSRMADTGPEEVTVTGMLRPLDKPLEQKLRDEGYKYGGIAVEQRYMLVEGEAPGSFGGAVALIVTSGVLLAMFGFAVVRRNVIFIPAALTHETALDTAAPATVFVSGSLVLDKTSRHFAHVPAAIGSLPSGDLAIVSNIDASSRFMGFTTADRSGLWMMAIQRGTVTDAQPGHVFWGLEKFRAVRFRYVSVRTGRPERAVVAAASGSPAMALLG